MASYVDETEIILSHMDDATYQQESWSSSNSSNLDNSLQQSDRTYFENAFQDYSLPEDVGFEGFIPQLASTRENLAGALNSVLNRNETSVTGLAEPVWASNRDNNPAEESLNKCNITSKCIPKTNTPIS